VTITRKDTMTSWNPIRRKAVGALMLAVAAFLGALALAGTAHATGSGGSGGGHVTHIISSPDDGCPVWARDTFDRTTKIEKMSEGVYKVTITDSGAFVTQAGAHTPGDASLTFATSFSGTLHGTGHYTVTGTPKTPTQVEALPTTLNNSAYACKADVPGDRTTGNWPKRYFADGATVTGIEGWVWKYDTWCEHRVETPSGAHGNITKACVQPSHSHETKSPCPSGSVTSPAASPTTTAPQSPYTSPVGTGTPTAHTSTTPVASTGSLPVTGPGAGILAAIGGALVLGGATLVFMLRQRREPAFVAE
jgi:hypothetical protein